MNGVDRGYASPAVRDGFLSALDRRDGVALARLARNITNCGNPLPSAICTELDIPLGSTYGFAARRIVVRGMNGALAPRSRPAPPDVAVVPDVAIAPDIAMASDVAIAPDVAIATDTK